MEGEGRKLPVSKIMTSSTVNRVDVLVLSLHEELEGEE
jgi:hypothetical protein